jgi:hypothetical protein
MPARFPRLLPCTLLLSAATLGCGDDTTGPDRVVYAISATHINTEPLPDGAVRYTYTVRVTDGGNLNIAGAWMLFEVSHGDVTPQTDRTDNSGNGRVEWTFDAEDLVGLTTATLSGCAQNIAPPDCATEVLATLTFD